MKIVWQLQHEFALSVEHVYKIRNIASILNTLHEIIVAIINYIHIFDTTAMKMKFWFLLAGVHKETFMNLNMLKKMQFRIVLPSCEHASRPGLYQ